MVVGDLRGCHACGDANLIPNAETRIGTGDRIQRIAAQDHVERLIDIETAEMSEACLAEVHSIDGVWAKHADRRGPHQHTVAVVLERRAVVQQVNTELLCVAFDQEVLPIEVCDADLLSPPLMPYVEAAVRIFFQAIEECEVVLKPVGGAVAEQPYAGIGVAVDESAEIAGERL